LRPLPDPLSWKRLFWLALLLITFLALMPWSQELPGPFRWSDKLNHFAAFVVLSWLLMAAYLLGWVRSWGLLVAYGAGIEGIQYFLPWRSAEWADLGVDALAAMTGLTLYPLFVRIVNRTLGIIASYKIDNKGR
jgi:VanZ family protein